MKGYLVENEGKGGVKAKVKSVRIHNWLFYKNLNNRTIINNYL